MILIQTKFSCKAQLALSIDLTLSLPPTITIKQYPPSWYSSFFSSPLCLKMSRTSSETPLWLVLGKRGFIQMRGTEETEKAHKAFRSTAIIFSFLDRNGCLFSGTFDRNWLTASLIFLFYFILRLCQACRRPFNDPAVARYPNGVTTHIHCARNKTVCPVTGHVFSSKEPHRDEVNKDDGVWGC